jgi:hypothetical protein
MSRSTGIHSDAELARQLGIDKSVVSRHKRRGMPVDSLEAAVAWRRANLNVAMTKSTNPARDWHQDRPGTPAAARAALKRVEDLMTAADALLKVGRFEVIEAELREAMAAVPESAAHQMLVSVDVMDRLCQPVLREVLKAQRQLDAEGPSAPMDAESAAEMGRFWADTAAGRVQAAG